MVEYSKIPRLLWLDDYRDPTKNDWLVFSPINHPFQVFWVKSYQQFVNWIQLNGLPDGICFDHDLDDFQAFKASYPELMEDIPFPEAEKTGMDCVKWLVDYCIFNNDTIPPYNIQSSNPVGKENMDTYLRNYIRFST